MTEAHPLLNCLLLGFSDRPTPDWLGRRVRIHTQDRRTRLTVPSKLVDPMRTNRKVEQEVADASFVLAEVSSPDPTLPFYLGLAHAQGKPIVVLRRFDAPAAEPLERIADFPIVYEDSLPGREEVNKKLKGVLDAIARSTELDQTLLLGQGNETVTLDWSQLSAVAHENLCLELLLAQGFVEPRWLEGGREVDLVALLPSEGDSHDLYLVSIGSGLADPFALAGWTSDLELLEPICKDLAGRFDLGTKGGKTPIHLLFAWSPQEVAEDELQVAKEQVEELGRRMLQTIAPHLGPGGIVVRIQPPLWGRQRLESLVRTSPMLLRRYFVDDLLLGSTTQVSGSMTSVPHLERRLGVEELYRQALAIGRRAAEATGNLEKRLEEDPAMEWQRRAYSVTHSIGNAIFPVETYVDLARDELRELGSLDGIENMDRSLASIEKAKIHIQRFKTIARWQEPLLTEVDVLPRLRASLAPAQAQGVEISWYLDDHGPVIAEPDLFDELMDELVTNSLSWLDGEEERRIVITVKRAARDDLPPKLVASPFEFLWIRYEDSGPGVEGQLKEKIFDLFFSKNPQGMGYGLAIARRNLHKFGGEIVETGLAGHGARFEIFLPLADSNR